MSEDLKVWRIVGVLHRQLEAFRKNPDGSKTLLASHDDLDVLCHGDTPLDCKQRLADIASNWTPKKWKEFKSARLEFFWSKEGWGELKTKRYTKEMLRVDLMAIRISIARAKAEGRDRDYLAPGADRHPPPTKEFVKAVEKRKRRARKIKQEEIERVASEKQKDSDPTIHRFIPGRRNAYNRDVDAKSAGEF